MNENKKTYQNVLNIKPIIVDDYLKDIVNIKKGDTFTVYQS